MPTLTINDRSFTFTGRKTILQVALENGYEIPYYCYHPALSIVASCRICLAEVAQPNPRNNNQPELLPKLVPTCQTLAVDGMQVFTNSPKSIANQKAVMEYLLINHPLDCPVCDQAGECLLQDYSYRYGRSTSRFLETKIKQPKKDIGPHVLLYADRCIMCSRCVRFCREITGTGELAVVGRGDREQIDIFPGRPLDNELSVNVVDICPVGALLEKDFLFAQRVWLLTRTPSIDGLTASGDNIWLEHNNGRIYRLKPRANLDVNSFWISDEIRYSWKFIHREDRLTTPVRQQYGGQVPCDWPRALAEAAAALRKCMSPGGMAVPAVTEPRLAVLLSPFLAAEEAYLLAKLARAIDAHALVGLGPIPTRGADKTFPSGYKIYAEKCPNSRGVRRAAQVALATTLDPLATSRDRQGAVPSAASAATPVPPASSGGTAVAAVDLPDYPSFLKALADPASKIQTVLLTAGYPEDWVDADLPKALAKRFTILLDVLPGKFTPKADLVLPGATWAEKSGTFENAAGRLQTFQQAINPPGRARPEGQIALDLAAALGLSLLATPSPVQAQNSGDGALSYNPSAVRQALAGPFLTDVHHPLVASPPRLADMEYAPL